MKSTKPTVRSLLKAPLLAALLSLVVSWPRDPAAGAREAAPVRPIRVLIVTGEDHPAHDWRETVPALHDVLGRDPRFEVRVVEDPAFLESASVMSYDVVLLHFMNWNRPSPGEKARRNLERFVQGGKGLFVLHFACGAFGDWPGYADLAGRVWDRKNGHDPRGPFRVELAGVEHPVTRKLADFEADDELYICLAGERPVEVLATARSRLTGRDHPMALAFGCGKGRVFNTPLGHDGRAIRMPGTAELIRRGLAWAAGRPVTPGGAPAR